MDSVSSAMAAALRAPCILLATPCPVTQLPTRRTGGALGRKCGRGMRLRAEAQEFSPLLENAGPTESQDSALPSDFQGAVQQAAESTGRFLSGGGKRAIVELDISELESQDFDGAQQQLWDCSRVFLDSLHERFKDKQMRAIFPDVGVAALLKYQWSDAGFGFASLNDRRSVSDEDALIVLVSPDYQMLSEVKKIAYSLVTDDFEQERPLIMWNPRLFSGDAGIGLNVRRTRSEFLSTFTTVYSLKTVPDGALVRQYPGPWKVFREDKARPGRYSLVTEDVRRPSEDEIQRILLGGSTTDGSEQSEGASFIANARAVFSSFGRFMRSLSQ